MSANIISGYIMTKNSALNYSTIEEFTKKIVNMPLI